MNITTRFLNCDPPVSGAGDTYEAAAFFNNPPRWWRSEHAARQPPTFLVLFDTLKGRLEAVLSGYQLLKEIPHTQVTEYSSCFNVGNVL